MKYFRINFGVQTILVLLISFYTFSIHAQGPFWGLTSQGGDGAGTIIRMDEDGSNFSAIFFPLIQGKSPAGDLLKATDGKFYGMTTAGGNSDSGVLFEYDINTDGYVILHHFVASSYPKGSLIEYNGRLYGMTTGGGGFDFGVIFEYNLVTSTYSVLYNFGSSAGDGTLPEGSLVQSDGVLYGMTSFGGTNDYGTIFQYDPISNTHSVIHSFNDTDGSNPYGNLIVSGQSLYGVTSSGGVFSSGVLFEYNLIAASISIVYSFDGGIPTGSLLAHNGKFYGMTLGGGDNFVGSIFEYNPSLNTYTDIFSFDGDTYGSYPFGSLIESGGNLYGMTNDGGENFAGVLFEYNIMSSTFIAIHHFDPMSDGGGAFPLGSLIISDGNLYGLTPSGGTSGFGTLFEFTIPGGVFNAKVIFENATKGSSPQGELIRSGTKWYGMTMNGGNSNNGTLFEYDPNGSGILSALHHFSGTNGGIPTGSLTLSNGSFFGVTSEGGDNNGGVLFKYNPQTSTYSVLHHFSSGSAPKGSLLEWNGMFYGLTSNGGIGYGEIFQFDPLTNSFTSLHSFDGAEGAFPTGNLVELNGILFGMATNSNTHPGVLFQYDPDMGYDVIHYFAGGNNDGAAPYGSLVISGGSLYGMTRDGGDSNRGVIFKYDPTGGGNPIVLFEFDDINGGYPEGSLITVNNSLYGLTREGGSFGSGVVFKCDTNGMNFQVLKHLDQNSGRSPFGSLTPTGCINFQITTVNADVNPIPCGGNSSMLSVSGSLNSATDWKWYTSACGGTLVGTGASITVMPGSTTTYYVRGEGGCTSELDCSSITITIAQPIVTNINDSGPGSLRAAISCAADGSTIAFDPSVLGLNDFIQISSSSLQIEKDIIINQTPGTVVKIESSVANPIFDVSAGKSLTLNYVSLYPGINPNTLGRAIMNQGNLEISNVSIIESGLNLNGNGSSIQNGSGSNINISSNNQIIIQN